MELRRFYFTSPNAFLVPIEELSPAGMSERFAAALREEHDLGDDWIGHFNEAYGKYFERAGMLHGKAPETFHAPRLQNLQVVVDDLAVRPYTIPFGGSSWMLYASDVAAGTEFGAYMLLHLERLWQLKDPGATAVVNLPYWLPRSKEERAAYTEEAGHAKRPDAKGFVELGAALAWVDRLFHRELRPPGGGQEQLGNVGKLGLLAPQPLFASIEALAKVFRSATEAAMKAFEKTLRQPAPQKSTARDLADWVRERRPRIVITSPDEDVLWAWNQPQRLKNLRPALKGVTDRAAQSLREDWEVISRRTETFLDAVDDPAALPPPGEDVDQEGGIYLHRSHKLIAYCLRQPGVDALREASPPYRLLLVAARTAHEWGHLSEDAEFVGVAPGAPFEEAKAGLAEVLDRVLADGPAGIDAGIDDIFAVGSPSQSRGAKLVDFQLTRVSDWTANLVARELLERDELEAYIRANVKSVVGEDLPPMRALARYAHEYQYLRLSKVAEPMRYFLDSTWYDLTDRATFEEIVAATTRLYDCYAIDRDRLRV